MTRYMRADFYRISHKFSRYLTLIILYAICIAASMLFSKNRTIYELVEIILKISNTLCLVFGLVEYIYVYSDDMKAKTMQIAIGTGIHRKSVIMTKWIEALVLCFFDFVFLGVCFFICCRLTGVALSAEPVGDVVIVLIFGLVKIMGALSFTSMFLFYTQNSGMGMLVYLAAALGIVNVVFDTVLTLGPLKNLPLSSMLFENLMTAARARALIRSFSFMHIIGLVLYFVVFHIIAVRLFEKRELEF